MFVVRVQGAPELLPFATELIRELEVHMRAQQSHLDGGAGTQGLMDGALYQLELDRIRFVINAYRRVRLEKVRPYCCLPPPSQSAAAPPPGRADSTCLPASCSLQIRTYVLHIQSSPAARSRLAPEELEFMESLYAATTELLDKAVLRHMPPDQRTLGLDDADPEAGALTEAEGHVRDGPRLATTVFARALRDFELVLKGDLEMVAEAGRSYVLSYDAVQEQLRQGGVELR